MLSVPQSATSAPQETEPIRMKERAEVLGALLSAVSGIEAFDPDNADLLQVGLAGTDRGKYQIPVAISVLRALPRLVRPRGADVLGAWNDAHSLSLVFDTRRQSACLSFKSDVYHLPLNTQRSTFSFSCSCMTDIQHSRLHALHL